ncbi:hypothetical protein SNEBB_006276 [Seison nebaliae]|nr:hypothetical protein SNEBB_006276 [Seison nebaliae]
MKFLSCLILTFVIIIPLSSGSQVTDDLLELTEKYQNKKDEHFVPPFSWAKDKGLFESRIRVNLHGTANEVNLRMSDLSSVYDNNNFVTTWILIVLGEASKYGNAKYLNDDAVKIGLDAISKFVDYNNGNNSVSRTFWPQYYNSTTKIWYSSPTNIRELVQIPDKDFPWKTIEEILKILGMEDLIKKIEKIRQMGDRFLDAFHIPPDFDDTWVNINLGGLLYSGGDMRKFYSQWKSSINNIQQLATLTKKYSYKPFSNTTNNNLTDPRSFYIFRHYLQEVQKAREPIALVSTWIENLEEDRMQRSENVAMPFNVNNVDATVNANSLSGLTSAIIYDLDEFNKVVDSELKMIYLNTTNFLCWIMENDFEGRPDLALTYYPSIYNFYWFSSRVLFMLRNFLIDNQHPPVFMEEDTYRILKLSKNNMEKVFHEKVFGTLKKNAHFAFGIEVYFEDFLGLNDTDKKGKKVNNGEDRVFSTSQAMNTLINMYCYYDKTSGKLKYIDNTPIFVKQFMDKIHYWLTNNAINKNLKKHNAFFSGSVKGYREIPFFYPINFLQFMNGTNIPLNSTSVSDKFSLGVQGVIEEDDFVQLLNVKHFNQTTPQSFHSYNEENTFMPFWCSTPFTYSVSYLALTQYDNLAK